MSAFLVSKRHIDVLVAADPNRGEWREAIGGRLSSADKLGKLLLRANEKSIAARYDDADDSASSGYTFTDPGPIDPLVVIKAAHCFEYQACEYRQWAHSLARRFVRDVIVSAAKRVKGYDVAEGWSL